MSERPKAASYIYLVLDIVMFALAVWMMFGRQPITPQAWLRLARMCWWTARTFGHAAIVAERNYWQAVRK